MVAIAVKLLIDLKFISPFSHYGFINRCPRHWDVRTQVYLVLDTQVGIDQVLLQKSPGFFQGLTVLSRKANDEG